ncbi:FkbM family methyltransferase [Nocardioides oleivorans]|uniref:FkbM family methyltransferase n=1 Tax=Nocardioides oleivorans TaxID=273676 RepID=A0A4Q2S2N2_9ACTN|nr:FkbM family methyltransferase [Nocardioides oleivorans]RYB94634.1 FkbM family methyltransferase [Nocardioides oleivorans]
MMNLLRRIASLPGLRAVLLRPAVRRVIASLLALRFLRAALLTTTPARFVLAELVTSRGTIRSWALRNGGRVTLLHGRDLEAFHELMVGGEYVPPAELQARLARPSRIVDLGGNIGMFAHWAHQRWPDATITSFEPDPENLAVFRAGISPDLPIEVVGAAAMTQSGHAVLGGGTGAGRTVEFRDDPVPGSLPAVDIFDHLDGVDFVKMDIEGGEWPILSDPRLASLGRMMWVIEYHRRGAPFLPAHDAARQLFEAAGFTVGHDHPNYWGHGVLWAWKD